MSVPPYAYISVLVFSLAGLAWLDYRYKIAAFIRPKSTIKIISIAVGVFLLWDIAGIILGIFRTNQTYVTGLHIITPNLPIEEILLLTLIAYITLLFTLLLEKYYR